MLYSFVAKTYPNSCTSSWHTLQEQITHQLPPRLLSHQTNMSSWALVVLGSTLCVYVCVDSSSTWLQHLMARHLLSFSSEMPSYLLRLFFLRFTLFSFRSFRTFVVSCDENAAFSTVCECVCVCVCGRYHLLTMANVFAHAHKYT